MFKWLKDLFKPVECYCQCHTGGFDKNAVLKGSSVQVSCEHCSPNEVFDKNCKVATKWGTKVPWNRK
jgi:hypothetical protein